MKVRRLPWYHVADMNDDLEMEAVGHRLHDTVSRLENDQAWHFEDLIVYASMYQNRDLKSGQASVSRMPKQVCNVSQAIIDSLVAKQVVNPSKATFDVDDGDWEANLTADQLERFSFGEMYRLSGEELLEQGLRNCGWGGDGWIKVFQANKAAAAEVSKSWEMLYDLNSCVSGEPRELYQVRYINKSTAQALYPDCAADIASAKAASPPYALPGVDSTVSDDTVRIVEAWHLPENDHPGAAMAKDEDGDEQPTGKKGLHIFAVNHIILKIKEWKRPRFPFIRMRYSKDVAGGYSIGLMEQLAPLQIELNALKAKKLKGLRIHALPRTMVQAGSTMTPDLQTDMGAVYKWTGSKPEVVIFPAVSPELNAEEQNLINQMYQLAGVSPLDRGADMPSRMDSRPGMREYIAAADEKHALVSQTWNRAFLDFARLLVDVAREIVDEHGSYETFGAAKDFVSKIDFKDINLEDDRFVIKLQNTNLLPTTPTGKRQAILDLIKANAFPNPMDLWQMTAGDHPDVDAILNRKTAGRKLVEKQMYFITVKNKYFAPDDHQDPDYASGVALENIQQVLLKTDGTDSERINNTINNLDKYIRACDDIKARQTAKDNVNGGQPTPAAVPAAPGPGVGAAPAGPIPGAGPAGAVPVA